MNYIDTLIDGNGDIFFPRTKEKAVSDDDGVSLSNKLSKFGALVDCTCTFADTENTYILTPDNLSIELPSIFSVRFKAPNNYISGATFTLNGTVYNPMLVSGSGTVPSDAFASGSIVFLDLYKDTSADYAFFNSINAGQVTGGKFSGVVQAQTNDSYTTKQLRNVIISTSEPVAGSMENGDIWIVI